MINIKPAITPLVSKLVAWKNCKKIFIETKARIIKQSCNGGWPITEFICNNKVDALSDMPPPKI